MSDFVQDKMRPCVGGSPIFKPQPTNERCLAALFRAETLGPARIVGGTDPNGQFHSRVETDELLSRSSHVRRKGEPVQSLIARTGISPSQIRALSKSEIAAFCERAMQQREEDGVTDPGAYTYTLPRHAPQAGAVHVMVGD